MESDTLGLIMTKGILLGIPSLNAQRYFCELILNLGLALLGIQWGTEKWAGAAKVRTRWSYREGFGLCIALNAPQLHSVFPQPLIL